MRHLIPHTDEWHRSAVNVLQDAEDGDAIVCHSYLAKACAEWGHAMLCSDKKLTFEVEDPLAEGR